MWYLIEISVGDERCYTITNDFMGVEEAYGRFEGGLLILSAWKDRRGLENHWYNLIKTSVENEKPTPLPIIMDGHMYKSQCEAMLYMYFNRNGGFGWRVRRLGNWMRRVGARVRVRRYARRQRIRKFVKRLFAWRPFTRRS